MAEIPASVQTPRPNPSSLETPEAVPHWTGRDQWGTPGSNENTHIPLAGVWDPTQERVECFPHCGGTWERGSGHRRPAGGRVGRPRDEEERACPPAVRDFISWWCPLCTPARGVSTYFLSSVMARPPSRCWAACGAARHSASRWTVHR